MSRIACRIGGLLLAAAAVTAFARPGEYQTREAFVAETIGSSDAPSAVVWIDGPLRKAATEILGHAPPALRVRYWYGSGRTAWVMDEIGKDRPITLGVAIEEGRIRSLRVLQFRESRGWEIRYPFFTDQFDDAQLTERSRLDRNIDGISGATLSVRAAKRVATFALVLDEYARRTNEAIGATK